MKTQNKGFRSTLFKKAHIIMANTGKSISDALKQAWKLYRLAKKMLKFEKVHFTYKKLNGDIREAVGTLKDVAHKISGAKTSSENVFCYWDIEADHFRSFRIENIISVR